MPKMHYFITKFSKIAKLSAPSGPKSSILVT